jgi:UDPglucose--hexose-1-phosphate uridylyltransferase
MPELRRNPVSKEWVIIATERQRRPSDFKHAGGERSPRPSHDDRCPFCPGNEDKTPPEVLAYRKGSGPPNSTDWWVRVVPNLFPALRIEGDLGRRGYGLYDWMNGIGAHEVIIETPDHSKSISTIDAYQAQEVIWAYRERYLDLMGDDRFKYIMVFRNHGAEAGTSLEHPHSQLVALPFVPMGIRVELDGSKAYYENHDRCIHCDIIAQELQFAKRLVAQNDLFVAYESYASKFPFETAIVPKRHNPRFENQDQQSVEAFVAIMQEALNRIRLCLDDPPYNFTIHTSPFSGKDDDWYHWHLHILPRLTIAAGFEMGTGVYINATAPEEAAGFLRDVDLEAEPGSETATGEVA